MDDTLWISGLHGNLQSILRIASSFYSFTNILVNDFKARLLSSVSKPVPKKRTNQDNHLPLKQYLIFRHLIILRSNLRLMPLQLDIWAHGFQLRKMILLLSATLDGPSIMPSTICDMLI